MLLLLNCYTLKLLEHTHIQAITLHTAHLAISWNSEILKPQLVVHLNMSHSVTWLCLLCCSIDFMASSGTVPSSMVCWDVAALKRDMKPLLSAFSLIHLCITC